VLALGAYDGVFVQIWAGDDLAELPPEEARELVPNYLGALAGVDITASGALVRSWCVKTTDALPEELHDLVVVFEVAP
jgi:hypothetical protein